METPMFLIRGVREFCIARVNKEGVLEEIGKSANPLQLAHFGSETISITKTTPDSSYDEVAREFHKEAIRRAKLAGADFVAGRMSASIQSSYDKKTTSIGTVDYYLANFPL